MHQIYTFKGKDLYPFTQARLDALMALCPGIADKRIVPFDANVVVFLCLNSYKVVSKAFSDPDAFRVRIMEWVDEALQTAEDREELGRVAGEIMKAAEANRAVPKPDDGALPPDAFDPNS